MLRQAGQQPSSVRWGAPDEDPAASAVGVASAGAWPLDGQEDSAMRALAAVSSDDCFLLHSICRRHIDLLRTSSALCCC